MATPIQEFPNEENIDLKAAGAFEIDPESGKAKRIPPGETFERDRPIRIKKGTPAWEKLQAALGTVERKLDQGETRAVAKEVKKELEQQPLAQKPFEGRGRTAEEIIRGSGDEAKFFKLKDIEAMIRERKLEEAAERAIEELALDTPGARDAAKEKMIEFLRARGEAIEAYEQEHPRVL